MPPYTSSIQVNCNSNDITSLIEYDTTFNIQSMLTKEKGSFVFTIKASQAPTLPAHFPQIADTIEVFYTIGADTELIFGGTVITIEPVVEGVTLVYKITAGDWGFVLDSKVVKKNYAGMDPHDIVVDLIANFAPAGFTTDHVQVGNFNVATIQFNYQQLTRCLESLAKQIGWDWYISPTKDVHFYFAEGNAAGSSEASEAPIIIDDTTGDIEWPTLDVQIDITNMKNSIYVVGGSYTKFFIVDPDPSATPPEFAPVDIYTSIAGTYVYPLAYPYAISTMTVTIDGVGQAIGEDQSANPSDYQVLYNDAGRFIRFTTDPGSGHEIMVQGAAKIPIVAYVSDPSSIATYGEYQDAIIDASILSLQEAQARAQAEIDMFGDPVYNVKFNTISPMANKLTVGQQITLNSTKFGIANKMLIIKQINCTAYTPYQLEYQVQCLGSDIVSYNDMMLTLLQSSLGQSSLPDSAVLQVLIPVEETLSVTDAVSMSSMVGPYEWGSSGIQEVQGAEQYGSFGYGSFALGGGLSYPDTSGPVATKWGFASWSA